MGVEVKGVAGIGFRISQDIITSLNLQDDAPIEYLDNIFKEYDWINVEEYGSHYREDDIHIVITTKDLERYKMLHKVVNEYLNTKFTLENIEFISEVLWW